MSRHLQKLGKLPVGKLSQPEGGVFAGRQIPKNRLNDENWLKVLGLPKPPADGLYVPRETILSATEPKKVKSRGLLYKIAKAMAEYDVAHDKKRRPVPTDPAQTAKPAGKVVRENRQSPALQVPQVSDWAALSPDAEADYLGLEQLMPNESLSIIGAGITGLVLAWIINRARPDVRITVYDANQDVGGWMSSTKVATGHGHEVLFESGPRTLLPSHPGSEVLARILAEIGVRDSLMAGVPRKSPTNQKALVINGQIEQLPNNSALRSMKFLASSPLLQGARFSALLDLWNQPRSPVVNDESVHSFISRRIGPKLADRMISALMRGIYAADSRKLSARSVARLNRLYYLERTEQMSILGAMFSSSLGFLDAYSKEALPLAFDALAPPASRSAKAVDRHLINKENPVPKFSLYGFPNGIQGMARAIAEDLRRRKNVDLRLGTPVARITPHSARSVNLELGNGESVETNVVVSTVAKADMFETSPRLQELMRGVEYSSLAVVNVWVPDPAAAKDWFGILVPKTEDEWNHDGVIGVIFDSSVRNASHSNPPEPGSAMTVMLGGDRWEEMTSAEARERALNGLRRLGILDDDMVEQAVTNVRLQRQAIPLYEVGHSERQHAVHGELQAAYRNRVALIGMAFGRGCGVSDCVIDALTVALRFTEQRKLLHPEFFFNHWWSTTRPEYYA